MKTETAPTAQDLMNRDVRTIPPAMHLVDIVAFLQRHKLSNAPVTKREGNQQRLLGFVSEGDCLECLANELFYGNPSPVQTAETIMKRHPTCVTPETDIFTLTSIFMSHRFRHLPVVDGAILLGIVSRRDILKSLDKYYREWSDTRDHERFPVDLHEIINLRFLVGK
ncbi:CBS domain-containing protein [Novipirellula caenicola]|uniref:Inosine-5'-monophosphate dehydrogenase n=1 Tax=Novipirellula caenicola TaxID=1536901 RepID=A0ABP9W5B4_9BACT